MSIAWRVSDSNTRGSLSSTFRYALKRCWKVLPQTVRFSVLHSLCAFRARKRPDIDETGTVFVLGAFGSASGLGQGARLYARKKRADGLRVVAVDFTSTMLQRADMDLSGSDVLPLEQALALREEGTVVIHANPPQFQLVLCRLGKRFLANKRVVAYWAWELESVPDIWRHALHYVDAVEVPSVFVRDALAQYTKKKISVVPHAVPTPARRKTTYAENGVLRCLCIFDMASSFARKNPLAAVRAFQLAFAPGEAELTLKVSQPEADAEAFALLREVCAQTPDVRLLAETLDAEALEAVYLRHDVYLSLHRSEGYGLTLREAMLHGLHVVATGWSGNMDFMTGELAHPVGYTLVPMAETAGPFKGLCARWAEADVRDAAEILVQLGRSLRRGGETRV